MKIIKENTCCFFGHRKITTTIELRERLYAIIENLVVMKKVNTFLFGSKSQFNTLCYELVTKLKEKYPYIKRIYVRAEFFDINENYRQYLSERYEHTYFSEKLVNAGKAVYVERNCDMVDKSDFCIVYFQENSLPQGRKSGTELALHYAVAKKKIIIVLP